MRTVGMTLCDVEGGEGLVMDFSFASVIEMY